MTYEQIAEMMEEMGLPFAYHHFAEDESPAPPFLLFLSPGENTFSADNLAYFSCKQLDIELYTDKKQPELEEQVESVLSQHEIYYTIDCQVKCNTIREKNFEAPRRESEN